MSEAFKWHQRLLPRTDISLTALFFTGKWHYFVNNQISSASCSSRCMQATSLYGLIILKYDACTKYIYMKLLFLTYLCVKCFAFCFCSGLRVGSSVKTEAHDAGTTPFWMKSYASLQAIGTIASRPIE